MRKRKYLNLTLLLVMAIVLTACSSNAKEKVETVEEVETVHEIVDSKESYKTEQTANDDSFLKWLPSDVGHQLSETTDIPKLREQIIEYYQIPQDFFTDTRYYYNYVDLNNDGKQEIFVVVVGMYTSGSGGSSALWVDAENGMDILQAFTLVNTPIIITDEVKNGGRELILQRYGGGAELEYVVLEYNNGIYTNVSDAKAINNVGQIKGKAIICNDLAKDMENKNFLTLEN